MLATVVHISQPHDVRIDRTTKWGNPHRMGSEADRIAVIAAYRHALWANITEGHVDLHELASLHGKRLACHCAPKPCHGDVLARAAEWAHGLLHTTPEDHPATRARLERFAV